MTSRYASACRFDFRALIGAAVLCAGMPAGAAPYYVPITPIMSDRTVTLNGHDLTIDQIVMVARHGAKVELSAEARQHQADSYGLLLEAAAEGIPVYWFNRGAGDQRETVMFEGDPLSPKNHALIEKNQAQRFASGALWGTGPEIDHEEIVRAMMVVRANAMVHNAPSPQLSQMLLDLLNERITPVVQSRGTLGEGDLQQLGNVGGAMVGAGEAYYQGVRMKADQALKSAGLTPIQPFAADDNALTSSNAYATGQSALLVHDARDALEWSDLIYAIDLNGMNSSITPLSLAVQHDRPEKWLNWHAARVLDMIKGSYLFDTDAKRIIQDPESLRASSIRQASTWEAWAALRDAVVFQANSSDHNPAVNVGMSPQDSWELSTPQLIRFFVNPFFTGVAASDVLPGVSDGFVDFAPVDLQQEIQSLMNPVAPFGSAIVGTVEDLQAQTRIKTQRARQAVETTFDLLSFDLLEGSFWMDARRAQGPERSFGAAPTAAWTAFRQRVPLRHSAEPAAQSASLSAAEFLKTTAASSFYRGGAEP